MVRSRYYLRARREENDSEPATTHHGMPRALNRRRSPRSAPCRSRAPVSVLNETGEGLLPREHDALRERLVGRDVAHEVDAGRDAAAVCLAVELRLVSAHAVFAVREHFDHTSLDVQQ